WRPTSRAYTSPGRPRRARRRASACSWKTATSTRPESSRPFKAWPLPNRPRPRIGNWKPDLKSGSPTPASGASKIEGMCDEPPYLRPYRQAVERHGAGFEATLWLSKRGQRTRFAVIADMVDLRDLRVLDAGCGNGDLCEFLHD